MPSENGGSGKQNGDWAGQGVFVTLRRIKDNWLLIVALVSALFWVRDTVELYARLPAEIASQRRLIEELENRLLRLESVAANGPDNDGDAGQEENCPPGARSGTRGADRSGPSRGLLVKDCTLPLSRGGDGRDTMDGGGERH